MVIFRIAGAVFSLIHCVLFTAGEEVVKLQELEGTTVTLHTGLTGVQSDDQILWFYGSEKSDIRIVNSQIIRGEDVTDYYTDRFRDRLQLNRSSGSLTIRNISREDSGVYLLQIISKRISVWRFSVKVYAPVSKPVIRTRAERRSVLSRGLCSPVCSVENGENVSLYWYEDEERISSISRADSSDSSLHLPLNRTFPTNYTYTCVSDNPVSNQSTQLHITQLCPFNEAKCPRSCVRTAVLISVGLFGAALILISLIWYWKKRKNIPVSEEEVNYSEVKIGPQKPEKNSENSKEENGTRVQDQDSSVVYSDIKM